MIVLLVGLLRLDAFEWIYVFRLVESEVPGGAVINRLVAVFFLVGGQSLHIIIRILLLAVRPFHRVHRLQINYEFGLVLLHSGLKTVVFDLEAAVV